MMKKINTVVVTFFLVLALSVSAYFIYVNNEDSFSVNTVFIKSNIPIGGDTYSDIRITNNLVNPQSFEILFDDLVGIASVDENKFSIDSKKERIIRVLLDDTNQKSEIYSGQIVIKSKDLIKKIPIILGVVDELNNIAIIQNIIPKYEDIYPGGKLGIEIKAFNLGGAEIVTIPANFVIKNLKNEIIWSDDGSLIIDGSISKVIDLPNNLPLDNYVFVVEGFYGGRSVFSSNLFEVASKRGTDRNFELDYVVIILVGITIFAIFFFFYFIKSRDDLLLELRAQQSKEIKRNLELIRSYEKTSPHKKQKIISAKKKIIKLIKKKQKKQIIEIKKLKKVGKKSKIESQLKKWKKDGYNMVDLGREIRSISKKDYDSKFNKWKKEGYVRE